MRLLTILWSAILSTTVSIPMENTEKGTLPSVESANAGAQKLLHALNSGDPSVAKDFFFPKDAFNLVKDLPKPERYHKKLMRWYEEDILKEHKRFRKGTWRFKELKLGWCKWKEKGLSCIECGLEIVES